MVKKKKSKKDSYKKSITKSSSRKRRFLNPGMIFINILLLAVFVYGIYYTFTTLDLVNGLALIAGVIVVYAITKFISWLKKR